MPQPEEIHFTPDQNIKALSWKEPFASLMLKGKLIETRSWDTNYRGWVLMCASKQPYTLEIVKQITFSAEAELPYRNMTDKVKQLIGDNLYLRQYPMLGKAFAIGWLCHSRLMNWSDEYEAFVAHQYGLYSHIYTAVQPIEPFDWKGAQEWQNVSDDVKNKIKLI